jgi:hypothetical protein
VGELQYAGSMLLVNGAQYALNASTGAYLYTSGAAPYGKIAAVMNGKFWSRGYAGVPYSMLLNTGAGSIGCKLLQNEYFGSGCSAPRAANGFVYVGMGGAYSSPFSVGRTLFAWDENGNPAWWFRNTEHVCQDVAIAYDRVYWLTNNWQAINGGVGPGLVYCFENDTRTVTSLKAFCVPETLEQYAVGAVKAAITYSNGDCDTTTMSCYFSSLDSTAAVTVDGSKVISHISGTARIRLSQYGLADTLILPVVSPRSGLDSVKRINFQAAYFPFRYGWLADNGAAYSSVKGFGWVNPANINGIRDDRGGSNFLLGSLISTSVPASYRIDAPDGNYSVRAGMGDLTGGFGVDHYWTAFGPDTLCAKLAGKSSNIGTGTIHVTGGTGITLTIKGPLCYLVICPSDQDICQVADDSYDCGTRVEMPGDLSAGNPVLEVSPNPFNTSVLIKYNGKAISTGVFDIRGTCVESIKPGPGSFTWNAGGCPAGVYMVMVKTAGGKTLCRKLTLMK